MASGGAWVLRPGDPAQTIYVVSASREALASIADRAASPTYFLVVGLPHGVDRLLRSLKFNLVIVLAQPFAVDSAPPTSFASGSCLVQSTSVTEETFTRGASLAELQPSPLFPRRCGRGHRGRRRRPSGRHPADRQYRASSSYHWEVETYLETNGFRPRIAAEVDDSQFLVEAAARGGHVAFVPRSIARDAVAAGRLKILARLEPAQSGVHALYQDGESAELARRAVEVLISSARALDT